MTFSPYISLALWCPLALISLALWVTYGLASKRRISYPRRWWILALMGAGIALPLLMLLNPTWVEQIPPPAGKPRLTILIDQSASMNSVDIDADASRYDDACQHAQKIARQLSEPFDIRTHLFSDSWYVGELDQLEGRSPDGPTTNIAAAIEGAIEDRPQGQAILLLSDGVHNSSGGTLALTRSLERARAMASPVFTATIGTAADVKDLEVTVGLPQEMAFASQEVPVSVTIRQRGTLTDRVNVKLLLDDQVIDDQVANVAPNGTSETTFRVKQEDVGLYRYEVRVVSAAQEVTDLNNRATVLLRVVDEPVKVLLLEGKPYWDTKFLVRTLSLDQSIDLTSLVRMAEDRYIQRDITRPTQPKSDAEDTTVGSVPADTSTENQDATTDAGLIAARAESWQVHRQATDFLAKPGQLDKYQIVILGREAEVYLNDDILRQLKKWLVEGDGSLVCYRGAPATQVEQRLGDLLPVRWSPTRESRFRVQMTESGQALQWLPSSDDELLTQLPSLATVTRPEKPKPLAVILATTSSDSNNLQPVISYQPVGSGRVVVVEGAGMWRWAFLPPEYNEHDQVYGVLWRSLVRWLVANAGMLPSQTMAIRNDKVTFSVGEVATATLLMRPGIVAGPPVIELTGDGMNEPKEFSPVPVGDVPGQFRIVFGDLSEGRYRARIKPNKDTQAALEETAFEVRGNFTERLDTDARDDLMRRIAESSGGAQVSVADVSALRDQLENHWRATRPPRVRRTMAWDGWWVLLGVFGVWTITWVLRRSTGLV